MMNSAFTIQHSAFEVNAMPFQAKHRFARISPRKARLLMDLVRGRDVDDALTLLRFSKQRVSGMIEKVIRSAVANASEQEVAASRNTLFVAEARVDPGPVIKRFQPKDRGKAYPINKRTSHLVVSIDERGEGATYRPKRVVGGRPGKAR
jgi:large subunit ribosomal protein L22